MAAGKSPKHRTWVAIALLFGIFFAILFLIFLPRRLEDWIIPLILSIALTYLFGMWILSQNA